MRTNCKKTLKKAQKNESKFYRLILNQSVNFSFKMQVVNDLIR